MLFKTFKQENFSQEFSVYAKALVSDKSHLMGFLSPFTGINLHKKENIKTCIKLFYFKNSAKKKMRLLCFMVDINMMTTVMSRLVGRLGGMKITYDLEFYETTNKSEFHFLVKITIYLHD
jgi:hypothetical protein